MMPNGWSIKKASEICDVRDGTHDSPSYYTEGVPLITSKNIINGAISLEDVKYISATVADKINKRSKVDRNDIILSMIGTVGEAALVRSEPSFCIKNVALFKPTQEILPEFLLYYFQSPTFRGFIRSQLDGGIQKFLSLSALRDLNIPVPQKNEQEKIANILSTWDEAIKKLDRIIGLTEKRFQGLGRRLLFNGANKYRLDDLCTPKQWKTISSKDLLEEGIPVFGANSWIGFYSEANHQEDCIAVTCRGATCGTVNYVKGPSYITGNSMALDSLKAEIIDRNFLYFYLRTLGLNSIISGSAQPQITGAAIGKVELNLPSLTDQINVSSILMDANKELDCFKKMKDKILIQKQGLMQQLLTGKKRVKV